MVGRGVKKNTISAVLYILFIQLFLFGIALADDFVPAYYPTLEVSKLSGEIKIDGELNDSGWENAAKADNFAEHSPGDQTKPPVNTEAFITYDENKLYVAMICYDDPSIIRASFCERDRGIGADDNICLLIDTYGDASWAYELNVNPYGIQADAIWSQNGGEDNSYDLVWESAGKITDSGYQIEAAIPFSSLRFPNKAEQVWKIDFWRNHPREVRGQYSWAAYDRDEPCWPCKWGTVTGIRDVRPGKGIEILPSVVGYKAGALSGNGTPGSSYNFLNGKADGDYSLGGKYSVSSNITLEATYNPDFSQVEADAAQIDVNSNFALSLEEKRPFFQEGSDLFKTIFDAVYTRSINNPEYAAKVTARVDRTSIAYLLARDENTPMLLPFEEYSRFLSDGAGKSVSNIIRFRHSIGENSHMGMLMTDRRLDEGGSNTVISADGKLRLFKKYSFDFQGLVTQTTEPNKAWLNDQFRWCDTIVTGIDTTFSDIMFDNNRHTTRLDGEKFWGHAYWAGIHRETANSYMNITYLEKNPRYRADNGFQPSNDIRSIRSFGLYHFRFDKGLFERLTPSYMIGHQWNFAKEAKDKFIEFALEGNLRFAQTNFHAFYRRQAEKYGGADFDNVWMIHNCIHSRPSALLAFGGAINYGNEIARDDMVMGREISTSFWIDIKPIDRLLIENNYNYVKSNNLDTGERLYEGYILRSRWNLQLSKGLTFRLIGQYNDFSKSYDLDPLLTYRLNPFSMFYIGSTFDYGEFNTYNDEEQEDINGCSTRMASRQFFMKLQYLFQL
ncbi:MAG: hypothetical protein DRP51_06555 [Candidatus Zixiibacteriota bacterium]|nr:MAG: hypothetical protein DRP51_06555 [candidate division Zixibacteria bacterium]